MLDPPTPEQWATLRSSQPQSEDALVAVPVRAESDGPALRIAVDASGHLHLLIPVGSEASVEPSPDLNGLRVRMRRFDSEQMLDLSAPQSHEAVFTPFCREVVHAVVDQRRSPARAVAATIRAWQSAWKPLRPMMDKTVQVGLFGELLVLRSLLIPALGPTAVSQWSGADYERHDFVGDLLRIEVKTTRKSRAEHEISRSDQLQAPAGSRLLFVSVQVEQSIGGSETLATMVDAIIDLIRTDPGMLDDFMVKLVNVGWSEELRASPELMRFDIRAAAIYEVDASFPRIPETFELPPGVVSLKYTVDLANIPFLSVDEAGAILRNGQLSSRS